MKNIIIIILSLAVQFSIAQTPSAFSYQGLLIDADGYGVDNNDVEFIITLSADNSGTTIYYQEMQQVSTDQNGVFNFIIGEGSILNGAMDDVDWLASVPFIGIEYDLSDGQGTQNLGFTQFNAVPFCFYSKYVVCQAGPKGFDGQHGPVGISGPTGPTGATGATGAAGATGAPGLPITEMLDTPPVDAVNGTVYLDNGDNTEDGTPGFRYFDGTMWIQL